MSKICVVQARVLAISETRNGRVLRLITMDWKTVSHSCGLQLKEHIGKAVYDIAEILSLRKPNAGMVLFAQRDVCDILLSLGERHKLLSGFDLNISRQMVLVDIPWMSICKSCHHT